ncbi:MAG: hypothetical protein LCI03_11125 [Actinobacteria bacterium]|jgi:hypothetical protein|nr:hypothetical protein [Actinomycetota bacterium]
MTFDVGSVDHEHAFFAHEDPRYLICACGQYAVRCRDMIGQASVRLIDPPTPVLRAPLRPVPSARDTDVRVVQTEPVALPA